MRSLLFLIATLWIPAAFAAEIDFALDVVPVLTKAGCNGGACHGAAVGRGGFGLSLYGSDPAADYLALVRQLEGRRINLANPQQSLVILKATETIEHGGGQRLEADGEGVNRIEQWIEQGAQNLFCDDEECDTTNLTYTNTIEPMIAMHCLGCHNDANPLGGLSLQGYDKVADVANDGRLMGTITHEPGYPAMPKNGMKLSDCKILQIETWINNGLPN